MEERRIIELFESIYKKNYIMYENIVYENYNLYKENKEDILKYTTLKLIHACESHLSNLLDILESIKDNYTYMYYSQQLEQKLEDLNELEQEIKEMGKSK